MLLNGIETPDFHGMFATRSQAARKAARLELKSFQTVRVGVSGFRLFSMPDHPKLDAALEYAGACDWISHVEVHRIDEGRSPGTKVVFVVTCFKEEIPSDELIEGFEIEPITPSLWGDDKEAFEHRSRSTKSAGEPRAKSDVESPTKLVWKIADENCPDELTKDARAKLIDLCVAQGVNKATASTQLYRWAKARGK